MTRFAERGPVRLLNDDGNCPLPALSRPLVVNLTVLAAGEIVGRRG